MADEQARFASAGQSRRRRAAGTVTVTDLVGMLVFGQPARTPARDIEDLQGGTALLVTAFARMGGRFIYGQLMLNASGADPITWHRNRPFPKYRHGRSVSAPYDIEAVGAISGPGSHRVRDSRFRLVTVYASGVKWELAVPQVDVAAIRYVMSLA